MPHAFPILGGIIFCEGFSQSCLKSYNLGKGIRYLLLGFIGYIMVAVLLTLIYKQAGMGIVNLLWSGMSVISIMLIGALIYGEKLHKHDIVAFILILSGIGIVQYYGTE